MSQTSDTTPNAAQAEAWNGDAGRHWVTNAERHDQVLAEFAGLVLDAAEIGDDDSVLDVGCGAGATTLEAARRASGGSVLGADLSALLLAVATRRADQEGLASVRFEQADAQVHPFPAGEFDVAISRFGVMFFDDPPAAWANIARALRPGGRLAFCCWREDELNDYFSVPRAVVAPLVPPQPPADPAAPGASSLARPDHVRNLLGDAGFTDIDLTPVTTTLRIGADPRDAATFISGMGTVRGLLAEASPETKEAAVQALRDTFASRVTDDGVRLGAAIWVVTARRA